MKSPRKIELEWIDSTERGFVDRVWCDPDEIDGHLTSHFTTGYLIKTTKNSYIVAHSLGIAGRVAGVFQIPRGCVVKKRFLK